MKLTGSRGAKFIDTPQDDIIGVLFFGPDHGLVREYAGRMAAKFVPNPDDVFAATTLTADDLQSDPAKFNDEMSALSLLGDARLVRVRLDHERPGAALAKAIKNFDSNPETAEARLIIEAGNLTPRSAVRKAMEAAGKFVAIGCYPSGPADIANMIRSEFEALGIGITRDALDYWVPLLAGDRGLQKSEIEKMALYKGYGTIAGAQVERGDVEILAAGAQGASLDDIIMAAMSGRAVQSDTAFHRAIGSKMPAAVILRSLQRHLTRLLEARAQMDQGERAENAMKTLRPPVFRMQERVFAQHLNMWSTPLLSRALSQSIDAEQQVKSAAAPVEAITGRLLMALATYARKRTR